MRNDAAADDQTLDADPDLHRPQIRASLDRYWLLNVRIMAILMLTWLLVGLGCGVLFADELNRFNFPGTGYPLGFWFAQQGSIIGFVLIILMYCALMNKLDARYYSELQNLRKQQRGES